MSGFYLLAVGVVSVGTSWVTTRGLIPLLERGGVLDTPNARSSHERPTPRGGGVGIMAGLTVGCVTAAVLGFAVPGWGFWAGLAMVAAIGWFDDRSGGLPIRVRLGIQVGAAALAVLSAPTLVGVLAYSVAIGWIVTVTNIYNFLDGIDGFAGTQGVVAGVALLVLGGSSSPVAIGGAIAGACVGFLLLNWHPARVFMGDVGSGALGFALASLPFHLGGIAVSSSLIVVVFALWFFLVDGTYTLVRRALRGERVWEAHRSHLYQRLCQTGLRHDQVVVAIMGRAVIVAALGLWACRSPNAGRLSIALGAALLLFVALVRWTRAREARQASGSQGQ